MTKDDIIKLAREAGLQPYYNAQEPAIQAFANLVAAHKAEVALTEAYRCGYKAGVVAERETIAQMLDAIPELVTFARRGDGGCIMCGFSKSHAAEAIRARGTT